MIYEQILDAIGGLNDDELIEVAVACLHKLRGESRRLAIRAVDRHRCGKAKDPCRNRIICELSNQGMTAPKIVSKMKANGYATITRRAVEGVLSRRPTFPQ
jgi:hypothetical protein